MNKLIRFEFRKLFRSRYFYVISVIGILFILLTGATYSIIKAVAGSDPGIPVQNTYAFIKGALGNYFTLLTGIFVAIAATEDNANGTIKNVIGKGYSRLKVFMSKYIVSLIGVLIISLLVVGVAVIYGSLAFDKVPTQDNIALIIFGQLLSIITYHAMYYAISSGFGKIGPAIAVSIIGPMGMTIAFTLADTAVMTAQLPVQAKPSNYWLDGLFANFTSGPNPIGNGPCFALLFAYLIVAILIGFLISRKKEY